MHVCLTAKRPLAIVIKHMGAFLWDDPYQDQWSKITGIVVDQMNRWIHSGQGFVDSSDLPWSNWSRIADPDPDHPKGTHPWSPAFPVYNDLAEAHWEVYVDICDVSFKYSRETWNWSRRTITTKLQETNFCSSQILYHEPNRNQERCWERWMLYEAFKRR